MKVLVISHNVFSNNSNMGRTLANYFSGIDKRDIAQLYFHSEVPTINLCTNYLRITDVDMLLKRRKYTGKIFGENDICLSLTNSRVDTEGLTKIYNIGRKKKPYIYIGRNILWSTKKWKNKKLLKWLDDFNPDVIFFASGDYVFSYKIAMEIAKMRNIPIVTYICDDYYFTKRKSVSPLYYLNRVWYKKTVKRLLTNYKNVVAICDKITNDYQKEFGIKSNTVMTISSLSAFEEKESESIKISYIGNMGYDRHLPLIEIGKALRDLTDGEIFLDIYSAETRLEILNQLNSENGINFHGSIPYDQVIKVMKDSDILVHVEDIKEVNRERVRYSVSTKIADSLSCGRCLFAYGPYDVASIKYLIDNDCACVATDKNQMISLLEKLLKDTELRKSYANKGVLVAIENHNYENNCDKILKILCEAVRV